MASAVHGDGRAVDGARVRRQGPSGHSSARAAGAASTARSAGRANPTPPQLNKYGPPREGRIRAGVDRRAGSRTHDTTRLGFGTEAPGGAGRRPRRSSRSRHDHFRLSQPSCRRQRRGHDGVGFTPSICRSKIRSTTSGDNGCHGRPYRGGYGWRKEGISSDWPFVWLLGGVKLGGRGS